MSLARNFSASQNATEESQNKKETSHVKNFLKSRLMSGEFSKQSLLLIFKIKVLCYWKAICYKIVVCIWLPEDFGVWRLVIYNIEFRNYYVFESDWGVF